MEHTEGDKHKASVWQETRTPLYVMARLLDKRGKPQQVDMVGIDIGKVHTGICGFDCSPSSSKWPRVSAIALVDSQARIAHDACDKLDLIFASDPHFQWLRDCSRIHIEQQMPQNPQAKQVAQGIRYPVFPSMEFFENVY